MKSLTKQVKRVEFVVVIPTYNEAENVKALLCQLATVIGDHPWLSAHIIIVDDSSPDGTGRIAKQTARELRGSTFSVSVLSRPAKDGLGRAYLHGFTYVLDRIPHAKYVIEMDADLSHNPKYIPEFVERAESQHLDLVIGSRYIRGGGTPGWSRDRRLLSRGANLYARLVLGKGISDYTSGYNLYATSIMRQIPLDEMHSDGYSFQIELKYRVALITSRTAELPIIFKDRSLGVSKIPKDTARKTFILVPYLRFSL
ncbi:MAG TPA: polyprenol monophosphomannose synthase [Candidatus Saccharimonadales bacterium]|nr:polyprenol monophosphomannose synthase [Candidatus Saccharimonadales bacterium]